LNFSALGWRFIDGKYSLSGIESRSFVVDLFQRQSLEPSKTLIREALHLAISAAALFDPQSPALAPAQSDAASSNRRFISRNGNVPKVQISDPVHARLKLRSKYTNDNIHNLTAYLVTLK